ncbi:MAG: TolC family protein, partial [Nitrospinae bacterium]|nr:TolC family protein [Nitrospinota bacterium]
VAIAETKYSVGKGVQQDVLKAQVELSQIIDELIQLKQKGKTEKARLNTLMNLLPQKPISIPRGLTKTRFSYNIDELQKMAEESRPVLKQIMRLKERFQVAKQLAEREYYPDFNVGFRYGQREDGPRRLERPDFFSAFVGINIPLWHKTKQSRKVAEEGFQIDRVQDAYNNLRNRIFLKIKEQMDEEARGSETLDLIEKGILPQARQSLESALAGYPVDKVDFLTLLDNQITLFRWEIKYYRELASYEKTLAELENVVGKSLF